MKINNFGSIKNIFSTQCQLRAITLYKEKSAQLTNNFHHLLIQGQSSVFLPPIDFAYFFSLYEIVARYLKQMLKSYPKLKVLEIGCGTGWGSYYLAKLFPKIEFVATNIDERSIDYASRIYIRKNLSYKIANGLNQKIFNSQFDLVFFLEVIEHLDQVNQTILIKESYNSLKSKGLIIFSTPSREFSYGLPTMGWINHQMEYNSREQLIKFLLKNGAKLNPSDIEINRLVSKQAARRMKFFLIPLVPFVYLGHLLSKKGVDFSLFSHFLESRKTLSFFKDNLSFKYLPGKLFKEKKQTLAYIALIKK